MKEVSKGWIGGFFDSDGCITLSVRNHNNSYSLSLLFQIGQSIKTYEKTLPLVHNHLEENINVDANINKMERQNFVDMMLLQITSFSDVKKTISYLEEEIHNKQEQIQILLYEIIPRMENNVHKKTKEGFLEIIAWKEYFDRNKGGNRGKYNLEYFENKWGINLSEDKKPNHNQYKIETTTVQENKYNKENGIFDY